MKKFPSAFFVLVTLGVVSSTLAFQNPGHDRLPAFDKRADQANGQAAKKKAAGLQHLKEQLPDAQVDFDSKVASPKLISRGAGLLSGPKGKGGGISEKVAKGFNASDSYRVTKAFLQEHRELFGHGSEALDKAKVQREFVAPHNGMKTTVWQQELDGISVFEAVLISHITKNEELVNLASQFVVDPAKAADHGVAIARRCIWTGLMTAQILSSNMVLCADDGLGHIGLANSFGVVAPFSRALACSISGSDLVITWPAPVASYVLEMTETLSPPNWAPVANIVVSTNNTVVLTNAMSSTSKFYRLRRN